MTFKVSTGARNKMLDTGSLKTLLNLGSIKIYAGPVPADADAALDPANTLLCTVTNASGATGLTLGVAAEGVLTKAEGEVWSGVNAASGTATFYRHVAAGDDGTLSTTQVRLQGAIGLAGAEMNLSSTALVAAATQTIDYYVVGLPTL